MDAPAIACKAMVALDRDEQLDGLRVLLGERLQGCACWSCDVMTGESLQAAGVTGWAAAAVPRGHGFYVLVEASADIGEERFIEAMEEALDRELIATAVIAQDEDERSGLCGIREACRAV